MTRSIQQFILTARNIQNVEAGKSLSRAKLQDQLSSSWFHSILISRFNIFIIDNSRGEVGVDGRDGQFHF